MLGKDGLDLLVGNKPPFPGGLETTVDTLKLLRSRVIGSTPEAGIDLERNLCELLLGFFRPSLDPPHCVLERFRCHACNIPIDSYARHRQFRTSGMSSPCSLT
jgi:hypothetical protein